ncbi:MAG: peptidoglycan-associated lipoprotein Pal [Betaproteobacteria bacterium]|nr:peptidoglycan-associated lipoprotein Pal [Betaproteobacteria bacterium]
MRKQFFLATLTIFFLALQGCGTSGKSDDSGAPLERRDPYTITQVEADGIQAGVLPAILTDPGSILSRRSVYFGLDRYDVAEEYRALISAHARFLVTNRQFKILIQGNTDERGSHEYNLALGQRRAEAVRQMMLLLGVHDDQMEAVSLGKEKPRAIGHNEEAWAENRRSDILYTGEF